MNIPSDILQCHDDPPHQLKSHSTTSIIASFPGSPTPEHKYVYQGEAGIFSHYDIIKIGPEFLKQKGNVLHVVQPTMRSTLSVYDIHPPIARYV